MSKKQTCAARTKRVQKSWKAIASIVVSSTLWIMCMTTCSMHNTAEATVPAQACSVAAINMPGQII